MLLAAILLDLVAGSSLLARLPGLGFLVRRPALFLTRRLDRKGRSAGTLSARGLVLTGLVLLTALVFGAFLADLTRRYPGGFLLELLVVTSAIGLRRPLGHLRRALSRTSALAEHAQVRAAIEQTAVALETGLALPVVAYALTGLPGLAIAVAARIVARSAGGARPGDRPFARAPERVLRLLAAIPGHLTVLLLVPASLFVPGTAPLSILRYGWSRNGRGRPTMAAFAGALKVALGGPPRWIGRGSARVTRLDLGRAVALYIAGTIAIALVLAAWLLARLPPTF